MYGYIVTTHFNNYNIIKKCLDLLFDIISNQSYVVLYVNETTCENVLNIENNYTMYKKKFKVIYINDQGKNGGLTGTWNQGINFLLDKKDFECKVITILGHDTYINKDIKYLLDAALDAENNKHLKYFGPLYKNFSGKTDELWQDQLYYKNYSKRFLIGSLFTFPVYSLVQNRLNSNNSDIYYFDADKFPFGYNDIDWYNRFIKIGGQSVIIPECIIDHKYQRTWIEYDKNLKNFKINKNEINISHYEIEKMYLINKINELKFDWRNYLSKNIDLQKKNIKTQRDAINHYMTIGKYQNRPF